MNDSEIDKEMERLKEKKRLKDKEKKLEKLKNEIEPGILDGVTKIGKKIWKRL